VTVPVTGDSPLGLPSSDLTFEGELGGHYVKLRGTLEVSSTSISLVVPHDSNHLKNVYTHAKALHPDFDDDAQHTGNSTETSLSTQDLVTRDLVRYIGYNTSKM
jgi:hypothetical protein